MTALGVPRSDAEQAVYRESTAALDTGSAGPADTGHGDGEGDGDFGERRMRGGRDDDRSDRSGGGASVQTVRDGHLPNDDEALG